MSDHMSDHVLTLKWTCQTCGWQNICNAPGFAGDGRYHFPDGRTPCGPITAQRAWLDQLTPDQENDE